MRPGVERLKGSLDQHHEAQWSLPNNWPVYGSLFANVMGNPGRMPIQPYTQELDSLCNKVNYAYDLPKLSSAVIDHLDEARTLCREADKYRMVSLAISNSVSSYAIPVTVRRISANPFLLGWGGARSSYFGLQAHILRIGARRFIGACVCTA